MGSRTNSVLDFKSSQSDVKSSNISIGKLDLDSIRNSTKNIAALDLESTNIVPAAAKITTTKPAVPDVPKKPPTPELSKSPMGSRTNSVLDFKSSQSDVKSSNISIGKLDLDSIRNSTKNMAALDLESTNIVPAAAKITTTK